MASPLLTIMPNANRGSTGFQSNEFDQEYDRPSKSQRKREMLVLQELGAELVSQPKERIARVPMPEDVRDAILECKAIRDHEGKRRQMQYVGKKMRSLEEAEVAAIRQLLDSWKGHSKAATADLHALEKQRARLLDSDDALTELRARHPQLDVQHLRTLVRNARREQAEGKPPKAYREIFQVLKSLNGESNGADDQESTQQDEHDDED